MDKQIAFTFPIFAVYRYKTRISMSLMMTGKALVRLLAAALGGAAVSLAQEPENDTVWRIGQAMVAVRAGSHPKLAECSLLEALLPQAVGRYQRLRVSSEQTTALGLALAQAEGEYAAENARLYIKISDFGADGVGELIGVAWEIGPFERETTSGFERRLEVRKHPALEEYDYETRFGRLQALVRNRFIVDVFVRDGEPADLRKAVEAIDWAGLEAL